MLVFNPCIMVFSPLFNVITLTLTILTRKNWSSVFWQIANWSEHHKRWLLMLRLLLGGKGKQRVILLYCPLWCLRTMWEKMDFLLSHHTLLISMTQIILIIWHLIQQYERPKEWELIPESELNMCLSVSPSVPLQITLGVLFINLPVRQILAYCWKFDYFIQPHKCSHALCAHNLIIECFWYCLIAFLQHVFLKCSYFVHVLCFSFDY